MVQCTYMCILKWEWLRPACRFVKPQSIVIDMFCGIVSCFGAHLHANFLRYSKSHSETSFQYFQFQSTSPQKPENQHGHGFGTVESFVHKKMNTDCVYITCVSDSVKKIVWTLLCGQNGKVPNELDGVKITVFLYSVLGYMYTISGAFVLDATK